MNYRIVIYSLTVFCICLFLIIFDLTNNLTQERSWRGLMASHKHIHYVYSWNDFMENFRKMEYEKKLLIIAKCPINLDENEILLNGKKIVTMTSDVGDMLVNETGKRFYIDPKNYFLIIFNKVKSTVIKSYYSVYFKTIGFYFKTKSWVTKNPCPPGYKVESRDKNNNVICEAEIDVSKWPRLDDRK